MISRALPVVLSLLVALPLLVVLSVVRPAPVSASSSEAILERQLFDQLNAERSARGLAPVQWDNSLTSASRQWSDLMAGSQSLRHSNDGRAEIIARGWGSGQVTDAWMRSSGHRNLMVDPNLGIAGVGVSCDGRGQMWATIQFRRLDTSKATLSWSPSAPSVTPSNTGSGCNGGDSENQVRRLYQAYFRRESDAGGLAYWVSRMSQGTALSQVSNSFASSEEFRSRYGRLANRNFVELVYVNVMGRSPDSGGLSYWVGRLDRGLSRGDLMIGFSESDEFRQRSGIG